MMKPITRQQIKRIFRKVKKLPIPEPPEDGWDNLVYFSWYDIATQTLYVVTDIRNKVEGMSLSVTRGGDPKKLGFCDICQSHGKLHETPLVSTKTRYVPRGVDYRSIGWYMCLDYRQCNEAIRNRNNSTRLTSKLGDVLDR